MILEMYIVNVLLERILVFFVVLITFLPLLSKVVRLATKTWDNREKIEKKRFYQVMVGAPIIVLIVFILFYAGIIILLELLILK